MSSANTIEFLSMPNQWTPLIKSKDLKAGKPLAAVIDGVAIALFRDATSAPKALIDRCPHRSVALTKGRMTNDGYLKCPFHGMEFDGDGQCQMIPLNREGDIPKNRASAMALPCREIGGLIWLFTSVTQGPDTEPELPSSMLDDSWSGDIVVREWDAHWSRAIQTMLDVAHIPFVHSRTIGFALGRAVGRTDNALLNLDLQREENGKFWMNWAIADKNGTQLSDSGWLQFLPPNGMTLQVPMQGDSKTWYIHIWCVPLQSGRSRQIVVARRNFGRFNPIWKLADWLNIMVLNEDKPNVESADPSEVPPPRAELNFPTDASTAAFQAYFHRSFRELAQDTIEML